MIRPATSGDSETIHAIINDAARAYAGVIPPDRWQEPYMSMDELEREIADRVAFWLCEEDGVAVGAMGIQDVGDVTLIRHSYVRTAFRNRGIGGRLLEELLRKAQKPVLVGTWSDAIWAIGFYEKHGFHRLSPEESRRLLARYWKIPARQIETSVVLADVRWLEREGMQ